MPLEMNAMANISTANHQAKHLESITRTINDAIISADQNGNILSWNPAAATMFQYSEAEAVGQPLTLIVPDRYKTAHEKGIERVVHGGPHHVIGTPVELQGLRKDGTELPIELSLSVWDTPDGKFFGGIIRDISARKKSESTLNETEQKFRSITETANDAIISADERGNITSWNKAAERILGYAEKEVLGKSLKIIIPEKYQGLHDRGMERVNSGGEKHVIGKTAELFAVHKNGSTFPIELSLSTWEVNDKKYYCGILRDISERKKAEASLKEAVQKFRSITETANDAIVSANEEGNIVSWNQAAEKIFGYTEKEAQGQSLKIIIPEEYQHLHDSGMERVNSGGEQHVIGSTAELFAVHKDGSRFPIELSLSTWEVNDKKFYCGILRDISERKKAEATLREAEQKFRSITETANDAIVSADAEGNIVSWNRAAEKIFGYAENEVQGKSLRLIIPPKYRELHDKGIERVNRGGPHHVIGKTAELVAVHKDGTQFPIELSLSTWEANGNRFYCGILRDISERKKAEEAIEQSKIKLAEKANKLKAANEEVKIKNEQLEGLSNKLAKYLSRQVYKSIFSGNKDVKIESYRKNLTVFFSDIQGFTELTDRVESEVLTNLLNQYLNEMSKIALDYGGTIDKFIGDAVMIFFGDPETCGEKLDAIACVKMAIAMREKLVELRAGWDNLGIARPLQVRMGINSGFCTVGNFGSEERLDYTIVGSTVNLASRLETAARVDQILISHSTWSLVKDEIFCERREEIKVKGQAYPVQTYEVVNVISEIKAERERLKTALDGFNINIDFSKLSNPNRILAKEILEKALLKLE